MQSHPVQKREVFEFAAERVVDGIHFGGNVDVHVIEVDRVDEHEGADHVHGVVGKRQIRRQTHCERKPDVTLRRGKRRTRRIRE